MPKYRLVETTLVASLTLRVPEDMPLERIAELIEEGYVFDNYGKSRSRILQDSGIRTKAAYIGACSAIDLREEN